MGLLGPLRDSVGATQAVQAVMDPHTLLAYYLPLWLCINYPRYFNPTYHDYQSLLPYNAAP